MISKFLSVSISVFCSVILALFFVPFSVSADETEPAEVSEELPVSEDQVATIDQLITETEITTTAINDIVLQAVNDILTVLDDKEIKYTDDLDDNIYAAIYDYVLVDNTDYVIDHVRVEVHDIIIASITDNHDLDYDESVRKYVDKVYDDIFVVISDNQDSVFLDLVSITLLSCILTCLVLSYFVQ